MNWALIVANVAVYVVQKLRPDVTTSFALYAHSPALPSFITYAFLHGHLLHLIGNMLFLYIFGNNVNDKMGHVGYLLFYLAGAVFSAVGYLITSHAGALIGASGAVWAVTGAYLVLFPRAHVSVLYYFILIGNVEVPSWAFVLVELVFNVISLRGQSEVAHAAHVAGAVFGFGLCLVMLALHLLPRDQFDLWAGLKQWNRRRTYRDLVAKGYDPFAYAPAVAGGVSVRDAVVVEAEPRPDPRAERVTKLRAEISQSLRRHDLPGAVGLYLELRRVDPDQVLSRQAQLDVANQLNAEQLYPEAANAYEAFLRTYPKFEQIEQVELMLGLVCARYLGQYDRAKGYLVKAIARLHSEREIAMARAELRRIEPLTTQPGPGF
jgi:membrane associated rhomboid family serine protease